MVSFIVKIFFFVWVVKHGAAMHLSKTFDVSEVTEESGMNEEMNRQDEIVGSEHKTEETKEVEYQVNATNTHFGSFTDFIHSLLTGRVEDSDVLVNGEIETDLMRPITDSGLPENIERDALKPVHKLNFDNQLPIQTNKFYANIFLGEQEFKIFSLPYSVRWMKKRNIIGISSYGNPIFGTCSSRNCYSTFYINSQNPTEIGLGVASYSGDEFKLRVEKMSDLFVQLDFSFPKQEGSILLPIAQGLGFVTAIYENVNPTIVTDKLFVSVKFCSYNDSFRVYKYSMKILDGGTWLVYLSFDEKLATEPTFESTDKIVTFNVNSKRTVVQISKSLEDGNDSFIDQGAGVYPIDVTVQASLSRFSKDVAVYSITYATNKGLGDRQPLVFAMRHHVQSMTLGTLKKSTLLYAPSPVKGYLRGFFSDTLEMEEKLETKNITTLPWLPYMKSELVYNNDDLNVIREHAEQEMSEIDYLFSKELRSFYYKGKVLAKYANLLIVAHNILKDEEMTKTCLMKLKEAYKEHIDNLTEVKFFYDTTYKGITTTASTFENNVLADFGSSYYNDHQFFYGYFIYTAGIIGLVDKDFNGNWANENKDWVNLLVRDVANPSSKDTYFPVFRSFDWYNGHSWSKGLFESLDGKDEESSSEDCNFYYGMKIWASAINDEIMESRADLMLSVLKRSLNNYFYYKDNNSVMYGDFAKNQVSGILFENKVDYTTYFGNPREHPEYVHGIHVIPITSVSSFFRDTDYVKSLWDKQLSNFVDDVEPKWGILIRFNQLLIDPISAYPEFLKFKKLEDKSFGISLAWCLAFAAAAKNSVKP